MQSVKCCKQTTGSLKAQFLLQERREFHFSLLDKVQFYWENRKVTWKTIACPQGREEIQEYENYVNWVFVSHGVWNSHGECSSGQARKMERRQKSWVNSSVFSHTAMPHTTSQKSELWNENLLLISFHSRDGEWFLFGMCAEIPRAGFPEIVWWHKEGVAAGQLAPWAAHHGLWSPEEQAELPPQMAAASSSSAPQPGTPRSIFAQAAQNSSCSFCGCALLQPLPGTILFHFDMALASGFCCWVLTPCHQGLHFPKLWHHPVCVQGTLLYSKDLPKQKKLCNANWIRFLLEEQITF